MAALGRGKAKLRKPSPPRAGTEVEQTFQDKLEEVKRMRLQGEIRLAAPPVPEGKQVMTVSGVKTFLKSYKDWVEVVSGSGKIYYYNKRSLVNQWKKPAEWVEEEKRLNPPLPPPPPQSAPPPPPEPPAPPPPMDDKLRLNLNLKGKKKVKKRVKNPEGHLPLAYQKTAKRTADSSSDEEEKSKKLTIDNAFEDPDAAENGQKLAKLDPQDEIGHLKPAPVIETKLDFKAAGNEPQEERTALPNNGLEADSKKDPKDARKFDPRISGPERAENLQDGCAAALAFKNITLLPEATALYGENTASTPAALTGNPTYFTEYNLPCCLKRCRFPKEQDVLHELKINKLKRRSYVPPPFMAGLDPKLSHLAREAQMEQFFLEVKNYNNHDRLMTSRMGEVLVYKIPDEAWERYFHLFQVKLLEGVFLECRPSGYTHQDELVYSRTGKICGHRTFPEDEARCQAVLQAWGKSHCLCMYANKVFTIKRDDEGWEDDLYEARKFLERNGW